MIPRHRGDDPEDPSGSRMSLCVLHTLRDALHKARKNDRKTLDQNLKAAYRVEMEERRKKRSGNCENVEERSTLGLSPARRSKLTLS